MAGVMLGSLVSITPAAQSYSSDRCANPQGTVLTVPEFGDQPIVLQRAVSDAAPMLVMFHGMNNCIRGFQDATLLDQRDDVHRLWVTGGAGSGSLRSWNVSAGADDDYVVKAVAVAAQAGVRPVTITAVGISNGAGMATITACRAPSVFSAAVSVASWQPGRFRCPGVDRSLMIVTGSRDLFEGVDINEKIGAMWRTVGSSCSPVPSVFEDSVMTEVVWSSCGENSTVRQIWVHGVGHQWLNVPGFDLDTEIVEFARAIEPITVPQILPAVC